MILTVLLAGSLQVFYAEKKLPATSHAQPRRSLGLGKFA